MQKKKKKHSSPEANCLLIQCVGLQMALSLMCQYNYIEIVLMLAIYGLHLCIPHGNATQHSEIISANKDVGRERDKEERKDFVK